ncbi:hypothetical protein GGR54DRAFT_637427 [Hypoxylon sp. NC1633]|nr:hypothetical protein GGR54DRAFT_637427 [Hypoxylon sp. NC1633]
MPLELQDADPTSDFPALSRALFEAYEDPWQPFFHAYFPIHWKGQEAREAAIQEAATLTGKKIVDTETGDIASGALWNIYRENPFAESQNLPATWFPNDGSRDFAEQLIERHGQPRAEVGQRPHLYLFILFTHPKYRRRGSAQRVLDWGIKKADELGLELFLDATPMGRPLYEKNGLVLIKKNVIAPQTDNPGDAWREIETRVGSSTHYLMWPPAGGYKDGITVKPWEAK